MVEGSALALSDGVSSGWGLWLEYGGAVEKILPFWLWWFGEDLFRNRVPSVGWGCGRSAAGECGEVWDGGI